MTQSVLESMARAMNERAGFTEYGPVIPASLLEPIARAALIALRDGVTEGMLFAVEETNTGMYNDRILAYWTGMIDHVLQEGEKDIDSGKPNW